MKQKPGLTPYKVTVHEEIQAIEDCRRKRAAGIGSDWIVLDINESQRQTLIDRGYYYVRGILDPATGNPAPASCSANRLVVFTWLSSTVDNDRCRRESNGLFRSGNGAQ